MSLYVVNGIVMLYNYVYSVSLLMSLAWLPCTVVLLLPLLVVPLMSNSSCDSISPDPSLQVEQMHTKQFKDHYKSFKALIV